MSYVTTLVASSCVCLYCLSATGCLVYLSPQLWFFDKAIYYCFVMFFALFMMLSNCIFETGI